MKEIADNYITALLKLSKCWLCSWFKKFRRFRSNMARGLGSWLDASLHKIGMDRYHKVVRSYNICVTSVPTTFRSGVPTFASIQVELCIILSERQSVSRKLWYLSVSMRVSGIGDHGWEFLGILSFYNFSVACRARFSMWRRYSSNKLRHHKKWNQTKVSGHKRLTWELVFTIPFYLEIP